MEKSKTTTLRVIWALTIYGLVLAATQILLPASVRAATLPGWQRVCYAPNWMTGVVEPVREFNVENLGGYWGFASRAPGGHWIIRYDVRKIRGPQATRSVLQFIFYHECAHARFNTSDEGIADCEGLRMMRSDVGVSRRAFAEIAATYASAGRNFPSAACT